jgi:OTU domain-containing protein 3
MYTWQVDQFEGTRFCMISLLLGCSGGRSYHDGEHYNSVRRQDDPGDGPAKPIIIEVRG